MTRVYLAVGVALVMGLASDGWSAPQESLATTVAQTPGSRLITYSGVLKGAEGRPRTGSAEVVFTLYVLQDGGDALWRESQAVLADELGRFTVLLGATTPGGVPPEAFGDGKAQWLGVQVAGEAEQPRALLVSVPYAMRAADADTLGGKPIASFVLGTDLERAVEQQIAAAATTSGGVVATAGTGTVGTLGHETDSNTWFGLNAGTAVSSGYSNAFFGANAGNHVNSGHDNVLVGSNSGYTNTMGNYNVFVGRNAGYSNATAHENTFVGDRAGYYNVAANNTFVGSDAGVSNSSGTQNVFIGNRAGAYNVGGSGLTLIGYEAGSTTTTGYNTMVGFQAGKATTTGVSNSFFGASAGAANMTGALNAFFGAGAGPANTVGYRNAFFGAEAGYQNTTGDSNAFVGRAAGEGNTTGYHNTFIGHTAGSLNTVEGGNTLIGSGTQGASGISNASAIGVFATVTQSNSLVLGGVAGINGATVTTNVGIGTTAPTARLDVGGDVKVGDYLRGANNVVMGTGTALPTWSGNVELNNESGVGFHFRALTTKFDIGPGSGGAPTYPGLLTLSMDGKVGIGTSSPAYKLHVVGTVYSTGGYQGSDLRLKDQVQDVGYGVREVLRLRPVSYRWKDAALGQPTLGLIAQEVQPVLPELVARGTDEAGLLSLNYTGLIPVLVKAIQEQQHTVAELLAENTALKSEMRTVRAQLAALEEQMARLLKQEEKPQPR